MRDGIGHLWAYQNGSQVVSCQDMEGRNEAQKEKNPHNFLVICGTENSRGTIFNWRLGGEIEILTGIN